jgi:hypothetical protein
MRESLTNSEIITFEDAPANLDLSRWTGELEHYIPDAVAGDERAAQVAALRQIRDARLYAGLTRTWDEFCERHLMISRRSIDRNIRRLKEFGPAFFRVAAAIPIASQEYRLIRGHICLEGVRFDGEVVPFKRSSRPRLAAAVTELLRRDGPQPVKKRAESFSRLIAKLEVATKMLERYDRRLDNLQKFELASLLGRGARKAQDLGVRRA